MVNLFYQKVIEFKNFDEKLTSLRLRFRFDGVLEKKIVCTFACEKKFTRKNVGINVHIKLD